MYITHSFELLPVESLCSTGGDRHQAQQRYKHILRDYDKGHEGNEQGAVMESGGVVVCKMFSYLLLHATTDGGRANMIIPILQVRGL